MSNRIANKLLPWYRNHGRNLPWRGHPDPYAIWVSEIMLQQTRVETVIPYFEKWLQYFPSVGILAQASEQEVLNAWEGLGYYSRARNLHKAAKIVVNEYEGQLPPETKLLRKLPGIGRYTAGAIASIAFNIDEPALDGNLRRIYARLFDVSEPADSPKGEKILWELAAENLPEGQAGDYTQGLMDLGASICLPKNPRCLICPLLEICQSRINGTQEDRPVLKPKKETPLYIHAAGVIYKSTERIAALEKGKPSLKEVLLVKRPSKGLLGGMWEFPNGRVEGEPADTLESVLERGYGLKVQTGNPLGNVKHAYTHFRVTVYAFQCTLISMPKTENLRWIKLDEFDKYPMGKVDRQIAGILHE